MRSLYHSAHKLSLASSNSDSAVSVLSKPEHSLDQGLPTFHKTIVQSILWQLEQNILVFQQEEYAPLSGVSEKPVGKFQSRDQNSEEFVLEDFDTLQNDCLPIVETLELIFKQKELFAGDSESKYGFRDQLESLDF